MKVSDCMTSDVQVVNLVKETEARLGPVDILVNNSATNIGQGPALHVTDEMLDKMIEMP